jgi:hypothetical protein
MLYIHPKHNIRSLDSRTPAKQETLHTACCWHTGGAVAITGSMRMKADDVAAAVAAAPEPVQGTGAIEEGAKQEGRVSVTALGED